MNKAFCLLFALIISGNFFAQFFNFNESNGLPSNTIRSIYKSKNGKLWVGTESGLVSFNGKEVKNYFNKKGHVFASCWDIIEDKSNNLWVSFYGIGVARFDGESFEVFDNTKGLAYNFVRKLFYSKTYDCILALTEKGLSYLPANSDKFITITSDQKFLNQFNDVRETNGKVIVTSTLLGTYEFKLEKNKIAKLIQLTHLRGGLAFHVYNDLYFSGLGAKAIQQYNTKTKKETLIQIPSIPWSIENDSKGNQYIATWDVHKPKGSVYVVRGSNVKNILENSDLKQNGFWCLEYDSTENLLWIGSLENGLFVTPMDTNEFELGKSIINFEGENVKKIFQSSRSNIWFVEKSKLVITDQSYNHIKNINFKDLKAQTKYFLDLSSKLPGQKKTQILDAITSDLICFNIIEHKNHVFVGTNVGLFEFENEHEFKLLHFYPKAVGFSIFDQDDGLFICKPYRKVLRVTDKFDWEQGLKEFSLKDVDSPRDISIVQKQGDLLWFGSYFKGLFLYNQNKFKSFLNSADFYENSIVDIQVVGENEQLITAKSGKVYVTSYINSKFKIKNIIDVEQDFHTNTIAFARIYNNHFFIGTNLGILVYDPSGKFLKLVPQDEEDKFIDCSYNFERNELIVLSNKKLVYYQMKNLVKIFNKKGLHINIDHIEINNLELRQCQKTKVVLDYDENDLKVNFSANNLLFKDYNCYSFRIESQIKNWNKLGEKGEIKLFQLKPGKYKIWIKGHNFVTGIQFKPILFTIVIKKPIWQTFWFILGVILSLSVLLILFVRWRVIKKQRLKQAKLKFDNELLQAKMNALRAQMNPHFTFNAINSIQNYIIDNDTSNSLYYLSAFSKLIRLLLESTDEQMIPLQKEVEFLESYLTIQKMRFQKVNYQLEIDGNIEEPSRIKIPSLIIQPFIENVFEHAFSNADIEEPNLSVKFSLDKNTLICSVEDNGCGYNPQLNNENIKHKSLATKIVKERMSLLNAEVKEDFFEIKITNLADINPEQTGTKIEVKFPIYYN